MITKPVNYVQTTLSPEKQDPNFPIHSDVLGGFLTNDSALHEDLFYVKKFYEKPSTIEQENCIFDLVNGLMSVPYKINKEALSFFSLLRPDTYNSLFVSKKDVDIKQHLVDLDPSNKDAKLELQKINTKVRLQENILDIATAFQDQSNIYFPVKLDHRGRKYCDGEIKRSDDVAIKFYKAAGAYLYGYHVNGETIVYRAKWVDDNIENIFNFRNKGGLFKEG